MHYRFLAIVLLSTIATSSSYTTSVSHAEVYKWTDENGKIHFSDQKPGKYKTESVDIKEINSFENVDVSNIEFYQPETGKRPGVIKMYSAQWCGMCKKAKAFFAKKNIPYQELDIEKSKAAYKEFKKLGGKGIPLIIIGKKKMTGFSGKRFMRLYEDYNKS